MPLWDFALFENGQARSMSEIEIFRQLGVDEVNQDEK